MAMAQPSNSGDVNTAGHKPMESSTITDEEESILRSLGLGDILSRADEAEGIGIGSSSSNADGKLTMHPALAVGLGGALLLNLAVVLSLPPVLRGRGAPYLPTFGKGLNAMFRQIRAQPSVAGRMAASGGSGVERSRSPLTFVDLGSGDGRVVFRAAREGIFARSVGYEINPVLHAFASFRRLVQAPRYWSTTDFALRDLWKVDLRDVDVVAVYGLQPIMQDLGVKMKAELKPGAVVVSNVFAIPGWRAHGGTTGGVHLYQVPDCWAKAPPVQVADDDGTL